MNEPAVVETASAAPERRGPRATTLDVFYGAAVLVLCVCIWQASRPGWFPPEYRQHSRPLLKAVEALREGLDAQSRVWIVCQDREEDDLNWRRIAYALIPRRVLYLPRNIRTPSEVRKDVIDPELGSRGSLHSDSVGFTDAELFRRYLRNMKVTHLVVMNNDPLLATLTGIDRPVDAIYLLQFDPTTGQFAEQRHVPRP